MDKRINSLTVACRITPNEKKAVQQQVTIGDYISESDFMRTAIRDKLREVQKSG